MKSSAHDVHHYDRRLELSLANLEKDSLLSDQNKKAILSYIKYRDAQSLSIPRQVRYLFVLRKLSRLLDNKSFETAGKPDIVEVISRIENQDSAYDTKRAEKECIKCFYRWLRGGEEGEEYPEEVKWIKCRRTRSHSILPENLLTEQEVKRMAESCPNSRDRALILALYETGGRVGEILPLTVGAVSFDNYGAVFSVRGKTGMRRVRIIFSAPALSEWLNHHPAREYPTAPLWTSFDKVGSRNRLEYGAMRKMLNSAAKRCAINKKANPHSFRHSRASNLANVLTEAQMNEYLGWIPGSRMAAVYVHLSGKNVDNALFKLNGIKTEGEVNEEERPLKPQQCQRCLCVNPPTNRFCSKCGGPLDIRTALDLEEQQQSTDEIVNRLFDDPKFMEILEQRLKQQLAPQTK